MYYYVKNDQFHWLCYIIKFIMGDRAYNYQAKLSMNVNKTWSMHINMYKESKLAFYTHSYSV